MNHTGSIHHSAPRNEAMVSFYLIIFYLFLEFGRPQTLIPALKILHLPAITILLIAISMILSGKYYLKDKQTIFFILMMSEMVIHGPLAINNYWAFQMFYTMSITFVVYLGIISLVDNDEKYNKLIRCFLAIFIFLSIVGFLNRGRGVGGFIGDENDFCMALNMVLPFALFGILSGNKSSSKIYYVFLTGLYLFAIIITKSRGGFVGLVSVAVYCWFRSAHKIKLAILASVFIVFALLMAPPDYWDEVRSITDERTMTVGTGGQRIYAWKLGWDIFVNNPILGVGQGNYPWHVVATEDRMGLQWEQRSLGGRAAHSMYFTLLPELGLVGTFLFTAMVFLNFKDLKYIRKVSNSLKSSNKLNDESRRMFFMALALEGSLVGFLASSVFISTLYYPNFWLLSGFIVSFKKTHAVRLDELGKVSTKHTGRTPEITSKDIILGETSQ